ncbi:hypothetical protein EAI30_15195 [Romboutsia ilealis]|uniref:Replication-associated protein ORF2/G2P domain-containing protein n=1 Tax=Romboutsia faecis TaxID=2764597 RepID=A0ABR7JTR1_9FIRM|nr:hypothetical protein [Romboutsia faecis]MBC5998307.1 hypothetical protein [Romboutsia faecis]MRN25963.1 hypothetical protein [Romboutsia ilealis]
MSNVKCGQKRRTKKKNMYTELDFEKLIDRMNEHQVTIDDEIITLNNIDQILDVRAKCIYETKTITSGPLREMEMYPLFPKKDVPEEFRVKGTTKSRKNLNNKNAVKYFIRKANTNFGKGDYYVTLNYTDKNRPKTYEEAKKHVMAYIKKLNYEFLKQQLKAEGKKLTSKIKKKNYKKIKYMYVIEISKEGKGKYHVHMILSSELSMDQVESCWKYSRRNNIRRIDPDDRHITDLAEYLSKDPNGKKRWGCSKGLKEPVITTSKKVSKRKIYNMDSNRNIIEEEMEKINPGYKLIEFEITKNKWTNMPYIHVLMRKIDKSK